MHHYILRLVRVTCTHTSGSGGASYLSSLGFADLLRIKVTAEKPLVQVLGGGTSSQQGGVAIIIRPHPPLGISL